MTERVRSTFSVMPAKAGIQYSPADGVGAVVPHREGGVDWVPAFTGTTTEQAGDDRVREAACLS